MNETVAAALGLGLLFLCVCVYYWSRNRASGRRQRADALARYRRDVEND